MVKEDWTMTELILFLLLIVFIWMVGYITQSQHDDIKEEIKKLNNRINQLIKEKRYDERNG